MIDNLFFVKGIQLAAPLICIRKGFLCKFAGMVVQPDFHSFKIHTEEMTSWQHSAKVYNFFEIIHVIEGKGDRYFNHIQLPYEPGQLLIYTPQDCRSFIIEEPTRFLFIRFSDVLFANCQSEEQRKHLHEWMKNLEYLFYNHNHHVTNVVQNSADCALVKNLMDSIVMESSAPQLHYRNNIQYLLQVLLNIFSRNVQPEFNSTGSVVQEEPLVNKLTGYIRRNIYEPELLTIDNLAAQAGFSKSYIGEYFKKMTGVSIRQYILEYRLNLVKVRLQYSDLTISEIAYELEFTDESHLSNLFKKYYSDSPTAFRRKNQPFP